MLTTASKIKKSVRAAGIQDIKYVDKKTTYRIYHTQYTWFCINSPQVIKTGCFKGSII